MFQLEKGINRRNQTNEQNWLKMTAVRRFDIRFGGERESFSRE